STVSDRTDYDRTRRCSDGRHRADLGHCPELLMTAIGDLLIEIGNTVSKALEALDRTALGFLIVVDRAGRLRGTVTDGDVRRALLRGASLDSAVEDVMR